MGKQSTKKDRKRRKTGAKVTTKQPTMVDIDDDESPSAFEGPIASVMTRKKTQEPSMVDVIDLDTTSSPAPNSHDSSPDVIAIERITPDTPTEEGQLRDGLSSLATKTLLADLTMKQPSTREETLTFLTELVERIKGINDDLLSPKSPLAKASKIAATSGVSFAEALAQTCEPKDSLLLSYLALSQLVDSYTVIQALKGINVFEGGEKGQKINEVSLLQSLSRRLQSDLVKKGAISLEGTGRLDLDAADRFVRAGLDGNQNVTVECTSSSHQRRRKE